ncbi:MAG: aminotransferase class V-fold PLP-dependent enzyme, partial [Nocardioidaceae bacterium]
MSDLFAEPVAYLDHAASTPVYAEAIDAMTTQLARMGNASALHGSGRSARKVVEESRETIAEMLGARPSEVIFTSGGTESDNLAVKGFFWSRRQSDPRRNRLLTSSIEHHAVLDPLHWLQTHEGAALEHLPVDGEGRLEVSAVRTSTERETGDVGLIGVVWANNEV